MPNDLAIPSPDGALTTASGFLLPAVIADQGDKAAERFFTFFPSHLPSTPNRNRVPGPEAAMSKKKKPEASIFVCYSRSDADLIDPIVRLLQAVPGGGGVFQDRISIPPGKKWRPVIMAALLDARMVLVFWCEHSNASSEVAREYADAIGRGKDVVPVLLDSTPLPPDLGEYEWVDLRILAAGFHRPEGASMAVKTPRAGSPSEQVEPWYNWYNLAKYAISVVYLTIILLYYIKFRTFVIFTFIVIILSIIVLFVIRALTASDRDAARKRKNDLAAMASVLREHLMARPPGKDGRSSDG